MASKKDFTAANTGRVYDAITEATAEPEPQEPTPRKAPRRVCTPEEIQQLRETSNTQGKKGAKAIRINMAFTPDVHDYIVTMSRHMGINVTKFVNLVFAENMERNRKTYEAAKKNREEFIL